MFLNYNQKLEIMETTVLHERSIWMWDMKHSFRMRWWSNKFITPTVGEFVGKKIQDVIIFTFEDAAIDELKQHFELLKVANIKEPYQLINK